jgi:hypothetical protein
MPPPLRPTGAYHAPSRLPAEGFTVCRWGEPGGFASTRGVFGPIPHGPPVPIMRRVDRRRKGSPCSGEGEPGGATRLNTTVSREGKLRTGPHRPTGAYDAPSMETAIGFTGRRWGEPGGVTSESTTTHLAPARPTRAYSAPSRSPAIEFTAWRCGGPGRDSPEPVEKDELMTCPPDPRLSCAGPIAGDRVHCAAVG